MSEPRTVFVQPSIEILSEAIIVGAEGNLSKVNGRVIRVAGPYPVYRVETEHGTISLTEFDEVEIIDPAGPQPVPALSPAAPLTAVQEPAAPIEDHPAHSLATHRLRHFKKRDDFTITGIRFGMPHRFDMTTWHKDYWLRADGDASMEVTFVFDTTPDRVRTEVFNVRLSVFRDEILAMLNAPGNPC